MGEIFDTVVRFFERAEWPVLPVEGETIVTTAFEGRNGEWNCVAVAREQDERFVFYCIAPENCPAERLIEAGEFLHRANDGLTLGCFELDYGDGGIRFRAAIDVEGDALSEPLCRNLIVSACYAMDDYLPGILEVIHGRRSAAEAIDAIEGEPQA